MSESLYKSLGLQDPEVPETEETQLTKLSGKEFAQAIVDSRLFREYVIWGIRYRTIPPAVITRVLDQAWGKVPQKIELPAAEPEPIDQKSMLEEIDKLRAQVLLMESTNESTSSATNDEDVDENDPKSIH